MNIIYYTLLALHIVSGATGLITGTMNLVRRKGDKTHRLTGKIFSYGMYVAAASALGLSVVHPSLFLFIVGSFTLYLVGTGNRYIYLKMLGINQKPAIIDWVLTLGMLVLGLIFVVSGAFMIDRSNFFGIAYIIFGAIGLSSVRRDFSNYRGDARKRQFWLAAHIQRMTGGYIAAITAFVVVNARFLPFSLPPLVGWLAPSFILIPFIFRWTSLYTLKSVFQEK